MHNKMNTLKKHQLALLFAVAVFSIMFVTAIVVGLIMAVLLRLGIFSENQHFLVPLLFSALASLIVGTIVAFGFSQRPLAPIRTVMEAADRIADGDYTVRISLGGPEELRRLSEKFNHMAEELGSVEVMRTDFVNNFSHEFKTPIVSIHGFAKMLKRDDLTLEEQNEYLDIIINESERLTDLSTSVLNLSKLEKQTILTEKERINVSEQIRLAIILLDSKAESKHIQIDFDCSEVYLNANKEMLKQIWINLLDNAVKFSSEDGTISIRIVPEQNYYHFIFSNEGCKLSSDSAKHIFEKFYQGDISHAEKGNGLGLTIAKRIVELHSGKIDADVDENGMFTVSVYLPM